MNDRRPDAPEVAPSTTKPTNQDVILSAVFGEECTVRQYSYDGVNWLDYFAPLAVAGNRPVYFRGGNGSGVFSDVTVYAVTNIDKVPPEDPKVVPSTGAPVSRVILTATFSSDSVVRQYSYDGSEWFAYTQGVAADNNGMVYFRCFDAAGNESRTQYEVTNIDDVPPEDPRITLSNSKTTREIITVRADFASDSAKNEYSVNGGAFREYAGEFLLTGNAALTFRSTDAFGNSSTFEYAVSNILGPDADGPGAVAPAATVKKYNATLKWGKAATSDKKIKVANYEIYCNGQYLTGKGTSLTLKNLDVGSYTCFVRAIDSEGRYGAWSTMQQLTIADVTAPKLGKVTASVDGYTGVLSWSGADNVGIVRYEVRCAGQARTVTGTSVTFENLAVGKYNAEVTGYDAAGNASKTGKVKVTVKDATPPEKVTGLAVPVADAKYNALLSWDIGKDNSGKVASYEIRLDDGKILKSSKNTLKVSRLSVGTHTYQVRAIDKEKNIGEWSEARTFTVKDMTAPTSIKAKATVNGYSVSFALSGKDNSGSIAKYVVTCGDKSVETATSTAVLSDFGVGKQTAYVIAYDAEGNASKAAKVSFTVKDATPPEKVIGLALPVADSKYKATLSWNPGVDNSGKVAQYEIQLDDGKILKSGKTTLSVSKLSVGTHTYKVRAIDKDKNVGEWSDVQSFRVEDVTAPGKVSVKAKVAEDTLLLTWDKPQDNVGVTGYELRYGASLEHTETFGADQLAFELDNLARGDYFYELTAFDAAGNRSDAKVGKATIKWESPEDAAAFDLSAAMLPEASTFAADSLPENDWEKRQTNVLAMGQ